MKLFWPLCLAFFSLGLCSCTVRFVEGHQWRVFIVRIDTIGKIGDNLYPLSLKSNNNSLGIFIKGTVKDRKFFATYIANFDTGTKLVSQIDGQVRISTEIYVHGKWLPFQTHLCASCGRSPNQGKQLKSGDYIRFEIDKPKSGWMPCLYRVKCDYSCEVNVDSIYQDSIFSKPKILFLRPRDISEAGKPIPQNPFYYILKKPIPNNFKLTWCDKITGSTVTKQEISKNDTFIIGHLNNYKKLGCYYKIISCECALAYNDTIMNPYTVILAGNKIPSSFLSKLASFHSGYSILFESILVEWEGKVFSLPSAKYLIKG